MESINIKINNIGKNKQLRLHQQNFKDASYQNSNYSLAYNNPLLFKVILNIRIHININNFY